MAAKRRKERRQKHEGKEIGETDHERPEGTETGQKRRQNHWLRSFESGAYGHWCIYPFTGVSSSKIERVGSD